MKKTASELRQDIVSGDWVVIATGRAKRPHDFAVKNKEPFSQPKESCPFEALQADARAVYSLTDGGSGTQKHGDTGKGILHSTAGNIGSGTRGLDITGTGTVLSTSDNIGSGAQKHRDPVPWVPYSQHRTMSAVGHGSGNDWFVQVVPNKYPAFIAGACPTAYDRGPYRVTDGIGFHEVVITRDHERALGAMSLREADLLLRAYQDRFGAMREDPCLRYVSIFHNHGPRAGATIAHPHSQIIALPVIPPDIGRSIAGSGAYFQTHRACVHCAILEYERGAGERVVYENAHAVAIAPFASKTAFELRVLPLRHEAYFETANAAVRLAVADALTVALAKLSKGLDNPDYNFFLHTAPLGEGNRFGHYHWHFEIIPKTAVWAGFEIGTGIEISTITPESAAAFLRKIKT